MKNKAFTLIELLAVIVIIVIIGLIFVPDIIKFINRSEADTYSVKEKLVAKAGGDYVALNKIELPTSVGGEKLINMQTLIDGNFIDPIYDLSDRDVACTGYVSIKKSTYSHKYKACLFCPHYQTQDSDCTTTKMEGLE